MTMRLILAKCVLVAGICAGTLSPAVAQGTSVGPSGLKIPRFVSLKSDRVNVRGGPSTDHKVKWIFRRAGLPVEIVAEFENWRRIRDSEGEEGWVYHSLLSGRRTALISPWQRTGTIVSLRDKPNEKADLAAQAQIGLQVDIKTCEKSWCEVSAKRHQGWLKANLLWGVYPNEEIN
ncbi:SH3 domain-containing protein [Cohaesibacter celericrescens]|uniref:SH3 domain-containing protein n=1 Tax=Cohaesibacter celericrescens TaxID=2067669 RepID=UPI00356160C3